MKRVVIVGGGIAGLSAAHALRACLGAPGTRLAAGPSPVGSPSPAPIDILVLERSQRPGGNIRTETIGGFLCEWGPNGFLDSVPETLALARAVGLEGHLQPSRDAARRRYIVRGGRLHELPEAPAAFLKSGLLSLRGKARIAWEPFARRRPPGRDETIHEFAARRIGREAASVLIDAMVSGVFAGDARALSLRACFPKMWEMETVHGGLFRALLARRKRKRSGEGLGAPAGRLTSFQGGMETLPRALADALGDSLRTGAAVVTVGEVAAEEAARADARDTTPPGAFASQDEKRRFLLEMEGGERIAADAVVLAGPASESARLVSGLDRALAGTLREIPTAPLAVVALGYDAAALPGSLEGFGFLAPRGEGLRILGVLWDSSIFPGRAPQGRALLRAMIGGAHDPDAAALPEPRLIEIVRGELAATMGVTAQPVLEAVFRHPLGIPQYTVGHLDRLERIEARLAAHPGLFLAGSSYRGVSINACIAEAGPLADRILGALGAGRN